MCPVEAVPLVACIGWMKLAGQVLLMTEIRKALFEDRFINVRPVARVHTHALHQHKAVLSTVPSTGILKWPKKGHNYADEIADDIQNVDSLEAGRYIAS